MSAAAPSLWLRLPDDTDDTGSDLNEAFLQRAARHYSYRTEQSYVAWIERYVRFHKGPEGWRHPRDLGAADVEGFLTHLAVDRQVSASTQNQALNALVFLYSAVLQLELGNFAALRAARRRRATTRALPNGSFIASDRVPCAK
jgi:site-specific recombinase XerD